MSARLAGDRMEALERLGTKAASLPVEDRAAYFFLCMAVLASNAPDVMHFILDRADERLESAS